MRNQVADSRLPRYAEVAVQLPVHGTFFYEVPPELAGHDLRGARVLVPFGNRGVSGVVVRLSDCLPAGVDQVRPVDALLDSEVSVSAELLDLCLWIASYYEAPPGEVLRAALPVGAQVSAQQLIEITATGRAALFSGGALSRRHRDILGALQHAGGALAQRDIARGAVRMSDVNTLAESGLVRYRRVAAAPRMRPRTTRVAVLVRPVTEADRARLLRADKQRAVLEALERAGGTATVPELTAIVANAANHLRTLSRSGLVRLEKRALAPEVARSGLAATVAEGPGTAPPPALTPAQATALAAIRAGIAQDGFAAYLLYGITGSGKTEVYLHAIAGVLDAGQTAVVLVPEISLTPQLAARFRARFGDRVAVLHSGLSDRQRFDEWQRLHNGTARIALGARSAVFAPVANLGIVVVDEEHDASFKQEEGVRYCARDVALVRAQRAGGVCVLGSATPSLESFYAAESGRYTLLRLPERPTPRPLPEVSLIDLRICQAESEAMLTAPLSQAIAETLDRGEQVILFLNRRGFDTFVLCRACGSPLECEQCSVSLTYHRAQDRLLCHYCGYSRRVPDRCPGCSQTGSIMRRGLGTEKVAAAVVERFAGARVARLDRDVARGAAIGKILGRMARGEIDILVGTQMVTKGHDFPGVTLVGVLCADTGLSLPDFRASEHTFQLLTQVAGRAGRGQRPGRVFIQSYRTDAVAIAAAARHDYEGFYRVERAVRRELGYPPFGHLVAVRIDGSDAAAVVHTAGLLARRAEALCQELGVVVRGPSEAPLVRLKGRTRWHLWLRAPGRRALRRMVHELTRSGVQLPAGVRVVVDVDPVSAL